MDGSIDTNTVSQAATQFQNESTAAEAFVTQLNSARTGMDSIGDPKAIGVYENNIDGLVKLVAGIAQTYHNMSGFLDQTVQQFSNRESTNASGMNWGG